MRRKTLFRDVAKVLAPGGNCILYRPEWLSRNRAREHQGKSDCFPGRFADHDEYPPLAACGPWLLVGLNGVPVHGRRSVDRGPSCAAAPHAIREPPCPLPPVA
jgi:hypothetical protein